MPSNNQEDFFIFNTHTHLFTKEHVPEFLARQFVPAPFYKWLKTSRVMKRLEKYYKPPDNFFDYEQRNKRWSRYQKNMNVQRNSLLRFLKVLGRTLIWLVFIYYFLQLIKQLIYKTMVGQLVYGFFERYIDPYVFNFEKNWNLFFALLIISLLFRFVRRGVWNITKKRVIKWIGKDRLEFLLRYINLLRYSDYTTQGRIFERLKQQYPPGSKFVVLPMDMEFMAAGKVKESYLDQMEKLMGVTKNNPDALYPFIHVDPRRIEQQEPADPFFDYDVTDSGAIFLKDCKVKVYLDAGACGIKIYPAQGYYPFAKELLPLWLYCVQNNLPITTHCAVGPIFYRGSKKKEWDRHPVFQEVIAKSENGRPEIREKFRLQQIKNKNFQANFTHPLNYCCMLMPHYLKQLLDSYNDEKLNEIFGYKDGVLARDLSQLKINLAHYGGAENWDRFLEKDRQRVANEVINRPDEALRLKQELPKLGNLYIFWKYADWFSLISSMMIEFDNIYSDISYTGHDTQYLNLLSEIMNHPKIKERVLFGTDFYVVSNQKTEKAYWIDMQNQLSPDKWQNLAFENPKTFMNI